MNCGKSYNALIAHSYVRLTGDCNKPTTLWDVPPSLTPCAAEHVPDSERNRRPRCWSRRSSAALLVALALSPVYELSLLIPLALGVCAGLLGACQATLVLSATLAELRARALGLIATAIAATGTLGPIGLL